MKTIIYNIYNAVKRVLNRFNPFVITRLLKAHSKEIRAINDLLENFAKNNKPTTNKLQKEIEGLKLVNDNTSKLIEKDINELKEINKLATKRHKRLLEKVNDLDKALQLATAMAKNEHDNLKDSFNKYVLRPKAEKMLDDYEKECEDYSYEYELEQKNEALIEALRQQGISDNVINNIIDTLLLKLKLNDEGSK